jgi:hypothetical protein
MSIAATEPRTTSAISVECVKSNDAEVIDARAARHLSGWDSQHACVYGAASAKAFGLGSRTWEDVAPLVRAGWAGRHEKACDPRHDWRLCWPAVKDGWADAGGAFDPPRLDSVTDNPVAERIAPARGADVFDAFGEPAGRVNIVREHDFLLDRPLARDVFVPFEAIRWPGRVTLRISVPNAHIGAMGWERPKILGLFGGGRPDRPRPPGST